MRSALIIPTLLALGGLGYFDASAQSNALDGCLTTPASKLVVDVRDAGAKGDGRTDDTAAIQKAIDRVAGTGGTVLVPDGIYMVNPVTSAQIHLKSQMVLKLAPKATLKATPNGEPGYSVLVISGVSHVTVTGGTLEGDREHHQGKTGEWGEVVPLVRTEFPLR